jgi:Type II secretory pathway, ATPase PulE/Tfp pilus assembly pathway, ATPase PilB
LVSAVLNTVIAQRLVRRICRDCITSYETTPEFRESLKAQLKGTENENIEIPKVLYKGAGCQICNYTGYRGQMGIFEALNLDEDMRRLITRPDFELDALRKMARERGMITMLEDGFRKAQLGLTTIEEVLRVIRE